MAKLETDSVVLNREVFDLDEVCIKYNKPGGSIHTSLRVTERTDEQITCSFRIEGTGIGMTQDFWENKLFEAFVQADPSARSSYAGTGLGMSIVKQLIEKMGGTIKVHSTLGVGSRFTVVLPFALAPEAEAPHPETMSAADLTGLRLLLAEDNELNMEIAEFFLKGKGAQFQKVKNFTFLKLCRLHILNGYDII